jgi:hypothetical protein
VRIAFELWAAKLVQRSFMLAGTHLAQHGAKLNSLRGDDMHPGWTTVAIAYAVALD